MIKSFMNNEGMNKLAQLSNQTNEIIWYPLVLFNKRMASIKTIFDFLYYRMQTHRDIQKERKKKKERERSKVLHPLEENKPALLSHKPTNLGSEFSTSADQWAINSSEQRRHRTERGVFSCRRSVTQLLWHNDWRWHKRIQDPRKKNTSIDWERWTERRE